MKRKHFLSLAALGFLASCSNSSGTKNTTVEDRYANNCVACHGPKGDRGVAGAADLSKISKNVNEISTIILKGSPTNRSMPPFENRMTTEEALVLAKYVLTLKK